MFLNIPNPYLEGGIYFLKIHVQKRSDDLANDPIYGLNLLLGVFESLS